MKKERESNIQNILDSYSERKKERQMYVVGGDVVSRQNNEHNFFKANLEPDSPEAKQLESEGYILIYPAEVTEESLDHFEEITGGGKTEYNLRKDEVMIVDSNEEYKTVDLASEIVRHSARSGDYTRSGLDGLTTKRDENGKVIGREMNLEGLNSRSIIKKFKEGQEEKVTNTLSRFGYDCTQTEYGIGVKDSFAVPSLDNSKLSVIYEKGKNKIKGAMDKIKEILGKNRNSQKTNESVERDI